MGIDDGWLFQNGFCAARKLQETVKPQSICRKTLLTFGGVLFPIMAPVFNFYMKILSNTAHKRINTGI